MRPIDEHAARIYAACRTCLLAYTDSLLALGEDFPFFKRALVQVVLALRSRWSNESRPASRPYVGRSVIIGGGFGSTGSAVAALLLQHLNVSTWRGPQEVFFPSRVRPPHLGYTPDERQHKFAWALMGPYSFNYEALEDFEGNVCHGLVSTEGCIRARLEKCHSALDVLDYHMIPPDVGAVLDVPGTNTFLDMILAYPAAKVILTTRDTNEWDLFRKHHYPTWALPLERPCGLAMRHVRGNGALHTKLMLAHDALVRCATPAAQLLELPECSYKLLAILKESKPQGCSAPANELHSPLTTCATRQGLIYTPTAECSMNMTWGAGLELVKHFLAEPLPYAAAARQD